ncbi:progranulin-like [Haliotis asinina]|uniref:progranulin-like n=1 Tax=Haliotis asinina TaxID=109174 RepID=UPI0035321FC0
MFLVKSLSVLVTVAVVAEGSGQISWLSSLLEFLEKSKQNEVLTQSSTPGFIRCDAKYVCPDMYTCCKMSVGFFCCPLGSTCGAIPNTCHPSLTPLLSKASAEKQANYNKARIDNRGSTGKDSVRMDVLRSTLKDGDQKKRQITGDVQDSDGLPSLGDDSVAMLQYTTQDEAGFCALQQTTCRSPLGSRCCPWPHASCCINGLHCCRAGSHCVNNQCVSPSFATSASSDSEKGATSSAAVFFFNQQVRVRTRPGSKARSGFRAAKRAGSGFGTGTQTDSGTSVGDGLVPCSPSAYCTEKQTCCKLPSGDWGCCPYQNATCCQDGRHCCPNGYTCDQSKGSCAKNGVILDWSLKHHAEKKEP